MPISSTGLMIAKAGIAGHIAAVLLFFAPFLFFSGIGFVITSFDSTGIILIVVGVIFFLVAVALGIYVYKTLTQRTRENQAGVIHSVPAGTATVYPFPGQVNYQQTPGAYASSAAKYTDSDLPPSYDQITNSSC